MRDTREQEISGNEAGGPLLVSAWAKWHHTERPHWRIRLATPKEGVYGGRILLATPHDEELVDLVRVRVRVELGFRVRVS